MTAIAKHQFQRRRGNLLASSFCSLNQVLFRRLSETRFELMTPMPESLAALLPLDEEGCLTVDMELPFLQHFLHDAEAHWQHNPRKTLDSGMWLEQIDGQEVALEATALIANGEPLFLVHLLGEKFHLAAARLQSARDHLLMEEALEIEVQKRTRQINEREEQIAMCLLAAAGCRDEETGAHIRRIGMYSALMAENLGWSPNAVEQIRQAAPMHDIGKIGIPDHILQKPGRLEDHERDVMNTHARLGATMLSDTGIDMMDMASDIACYHHERWDGSGYPEGLAGEDIPECARITTIVDVYDALVHARVYKPAYEEDRALEIMASMSGSHLDPNLFELFLKLLPEIRRIRLQVQD